MERVDRELQEQVEYYQGLSYEKEYISAGSLMTFNIHYGYLEGLLRGFRSGFLTENAYRTLTQVQKLEEFKVALVDSDYNGVLDDAAGDTKISRQYIVSRCRQKFNEEFMHLRTQATGSLKTFLDFIRMEYMIDNVVHLLGGMVHEMEPQEMLAKINPLGRFPNMETVLTFDKNDAEGGLIRLFETVLIDTPVGHLFERYFVESESQSNDNDKEIMAMMLPDKIDILRTQVMRLWLQEFYEFCRNLGGETAEQMCRLLEYEADKTAIRIMVNSFGTPLNEPYHRDTRQKLFCNFGTLYPEGIDAFRKVQELAELQPVLSKYPTFAAIYEEAGRGEKDVEDCLLEHEVYLNEFAFWGQNHFAAFWGYVKLKEQELRNIFWIADCITSNLRDPVSMNKWIPILTKPEN